MDCLAPVLAALRTAPEYRRLSAGLAAGEPVAPLGLVEPARAAVLSSLSLDLAGPKLIVVPGQERAIRLAEELSCWLGRDAFHFPAPEAMSFERVPWGPDVVRLRLAALVALASRQDDAPIVVAPASALLTPLPPPAVLRERLFVLRPGQEWPLSDLTRRLVDAGYRSEVIAETPGTFSRRGGIIDVFPSTAERPVRIDFYGDMIDSLRFYDPQTQRSTGACQSTVVSPASEAVAGLDSGALAPLMELDCSDCHTAARADLERDIDLLSRGGLPAAFGLYLGYLYGDPSTLLDYFAGAGCVFVDDLVLVADAAAEHLDRTEESRRRAEVGGDLPHGFRPAVLDWQSLEARLRQAPVVELGAGTGEDGAGMRGLFRVQTRFGGQVRAAMEHIARAGAEGAAVVITRQAQRFSELLEALSVRPDRSATPALGDRGVHIVEGSYPEGWTMQTESGVLSLFTDRDVFGWAKAPRRRPTRRPKAEPFMAEVEPGDFVVHVEHGIARYVGLRRMQQNDSEKEYLELEYAGGDRLYVPTYQVDRLSRYVGASDVAPALTRLGGTDWRDAKARARKAVEEVADELLELYVTRTMAPGYGFGGDDAWQRELESAFPYEETEDQLRTIAEVKADMELPRPMDRLIAGDVGYGKTEVALRAAFKSVMNGKQVAVLVPTTVLAQQHFETFRRRLAAFPVTVEMLSRFRSDREQGDVVRRLEKGEVDIVIGTHRLVQGDVRFKDLGLVVIDEEQRFGVRHKEALKRLRAEVDVITMTATPIPRTMNMALTGLRSLSTIDTPPEDRLAVWTYVAQWDDNLVQRAIRREMARGGQAFLVHDRVRGIELMQRRVERLVPEAVVAVGHGQLPEGRLASVMEQFAGGGIDVLVCTTIIESGLDIPNANTIIVNHADHFGLAQLYQLRGRVGRGTVRAYAYLLFSPGEGLTETARQRLRAIMEASDLGSGLQVAMRDLEIRGAGDILGRRQHGHIGAVGFDLYTRLLAQAVAERRAALGEAEQPDAQRVRAFLRPLQPGLQLSLPLEAELPESYIPDSALRLALYRRLGLLTDVGEIDDFAQELVDRFGDLPNETLGLLYQSKVKVVAEQLGVTSIGQESGQFYVRMDVSWLRSADIGRWLSGAARLGSGQVWIVVPPLDDWRAVLLWVLRTLVDMRRELGVRTPHLPERARQRVDKLRRAIERAHSEGVRPDDS